MTLQQDWLDCFNKLQSLSDQLNVGDPFNYNRGREIHTALTLGLTISDTLSGADAYDDQGPCELKSTIGKLKAVYNGISVQSDWNTQEDYIVNKKIGCYANHYAVRYNGSRIVEAYKLSSDDVLTSLLPKIKRQFESPRGKDPRIGVQLTATEIKTHGVKVYEASN